MWKKDIDTDKILCKKNKKDKINKANIEPFYLFYHLLPIKSMYACVCLKRSLSPRETQWYSCHSFSRVLTTIHMYTNFREKKCLGA